MIDASCTRRQALAGLSALSLTACAGGAARTASAPPAAGEGLHQIAQRKGLRFGSAIAYGAEGADSGSIGNPAYRAIVERECGLVVAENEMKWQAIRPGPDQYDFAAFDAIVRYAKSKGLDIRGHTLLWHRPKWMPEWVNTYDYGARPATEAARLVTSHIETVTRRYRGVIHSYDVVNELFDDQSGAFVDTSMSKAMGSHEAIVDLAFHTARNELPDAELVYNDYMSWEPGHANHRAGVLKLLEGFRKRGTPVDALGIQSHLVTQGTNTAASVSAQEVEWRRFLDQVVAMGYKLLITEFDVRDNNLPADIAIRDSAVADYTRAYLDAMFTYPQLSDVLVWGMCDRYSWIEGFEPRGDGAKRRPCPFDSDFKPKPMRTAFAEAFAAAPART